MDDMKKLYEKVSKDSVLQEKFTAIMKDAEQVGEAATRDTLIEFAKEAGYDITVNEMQEFFKGLAETKEGELSDAELDQVAGGKTVGGVMVSITTLGIACAIASIAAAVSSGNCTETLDANLAHKI